jgi:diaminopimelate epimerase
MKLSKFHSLGNDFLIVDRDEVADPGGYEDLARAICDRHTGVGADGLLILSVTDAARGEAAFRIFNADGSESGISGNGIRCAAAHLFSQQKVEGRTVRFATASGVRACDFVERIEDRYTIRIDLGAPRLSSREIPFDDGRTHERVIDYPLTIHKKTYPVTLVSMGNPHCVLFVDNFPNRIDWSATGAEIESHPFFPERTNVEFVRVHGREEIEVLFWERGVGETLSSGSGATAAAVAAILKGLTERRVQVKTSMGRLLVEWEGDTVRQTGPAEFVFVGSFLLK